MRTKRSIGSGEQGFTLIEVIVAMALAVLVIGASAAGFARNSDSAQASQQQAALLTVAQQQIEKVHGIVSRYGFAALALSSTPPAPTDSVLPIDPADPDDFIKNHSSSTPSLLIETNYNATSSGQISTAPTNGEPLEIDAANGMIAPTVATNSTDPNTQIAVGGGTATVYTFVTQATVPCNTTVLGGCAASDVRRVVVAVCMNTTPGAKEIGPNAPVYISTIFSNPIPSNQPSSATGLRLGLNIG
jgi:prepilin-type N-terminal cleavage/methylation domain-containing protein